MTRYVSALDHQAIDRVAEQTWELWGGGRDHGAHRRRIQSQIARSGGAMRYAGVVDGDRVVSSLKRYALALDTPHGAVDAVGVGALFTPPSTRGRGLARLLLRAVADEARDEGRSALLLFSDIDPAFYEELGFVKLSSVTWSCRVAALPTAGALAWRETDDMERLCALRRASYDGSWLRVHRTPASWRYGAWLNGAGPARLVEAGRGYVVARSTAPDVLWIDDAACDAPEALWASLAAMARGAGATTIAGWLRADLVGGPFVARPRRRCIPMLSALDGATFGDLTSWRSHFSSLDHF